MSDALHITDATAGYGRRRVLDRLTLPAVPAGSVVGLLGANGAGKSTLLKLTAGLLSGSGSLRLGAHDLRHMAAARRARLVGYLPQTVMRSSSLVVYEVLLSALRATCPDMTRSQAERRIEDVLHAMDLTGLALKTLDAMSGGQRQMVGLAQVLVRQPALMLLDEPTSALDLRWQIAVLSRVQAEARERGAVALVAMHDINLSLRFCDRVAILGDGLIAAGPPAEVLTAAVLRRAFGVEARVEACSHGRPIVLTDAVTPHHEDRSS